MNIIARLLRWIADKADPPAPPGTRRGQPPRYTLSADAVRLRGAARLGEIRLAVCAHFGISERKLIGQTCRSEIARARQIGIWLAHELTGATLKTIALTFGRADHTTALHALRRIDALLLAGDAETVGHIAAIRTQLEKDR